MKNTKKYDLLIVGAGIMGTFHALHALRAGLSVALIEKNKQPQGATTRNFGQVVPSGLTREWQRVGRESLDIYKSLQAQTDISVRQQGSIYLASNAEEIQLIEELSAINASEGYTSQLLTAEECLQRYPGLRADYCKGGIFFPEEVNVNPLVAIHKVRALLIEQEGLEFFPASPAIAVEEKAGGCVVHSSTGACWKGSKLLICSGSDFQLLFPGVFRESDIKAVKLQMLQTVVQPKQRIPGSILTGQTIRRYESFTECPSFETIKAKEPADSLFKKYGVHILFKQAEDGSVIIGDSHEYEAARDADDLGYDLKEKINTFMLEEARKIVELEDWTIRESWYGTYCQSPTQDIFKHDISDTIRIVTAVGGKGMTVSPAFAKRHLEELNLLAIQENA